MRKRRDDTGARDSGRPVTLEGVIRSVRRRWRTRLLLRGGSVVLACLLVALGITVVGLETTRFSETAVIFFRWFAWVGVGGAVLLFLLPPLFRRVSDEQVALYLEEREPALRASVLGAVEARRQARDGGTDAPVELVDALVRRAVENTREVAYGRRVEQQGLVRTSGAFSALAVATLFLLLFGPLDFRRGAGALIPTRDAAAVNPYAISVLPGDQTVARGSDQFVEAELVGFSSAEVSLFTRPEGREATRLTMLPRPDGVGFEVLLVGLEESVEYWVESDGVRSPMYSLDVVDLPYVDRMDHEYRFPAYTGLPVRTVEGAGDIAVLAGTEVTLTVHPTLGTPAGRLLVDDAEPAALEPGPDGSLTGTFTVRERGFYRVELALQDGSFVSASPEYTIDLLADQPPTVGFNTPGRDSPASPIEEFYVEAEAVDDYGIDELLLVYSVNGQSEDTVSLYGDARASLGTVTAGHTFYLEDFEVSAGDLVSYYAVTRDRRSGTGEEAVSDIYFVNIQPFRREFREQEQQGGGMPGGGGAMGGQEALSELQKQVVAATFNLVRDREGYDEDRWQESLAAVALAQDRVREQVNTLAQRMTNRGLADAEDRFREIAEMLPESVEKMAEAAERLRAGEPREALGPEQESLRTLQKAEETYERYVGQQNPGQGGGQGQGADADDLADLFELELDQLENQYETVQRGERQQANEEVDELLEEMEELARRQEQEAERQRARAGRQQGSASAGGGSSARSQRELADQAEEAARQLQRLSRETGDRELARSARELQEAADAMRQAAANAGGSGPAEARRALERIEEARRRLRQDREVRLEEDTRDALERVREMRERQDGVGEALDDLPSDPAGRREAVGELVEEKGEMAREMLELRQDLTRLSQEAQQQDADAARALRDAADLIEEEKMAEKIQYSRGVVEMRDPAFARIGEEEIAGNLEQLEESLERAVRATGRVTEREGLEETLEEARSLQERVASLDRRLEDRAGQGRPGEAGEGEPGEGGRQPGQEGRQGRAGGEGDGQQGQAGGQGGSGNPDGPGNPTPGRLAPGQQAGGAGAMGGGEPLSEEEIRQFRRELQERLGEARELRDDLRGQGQDVRDLDGAIEALQRLQNPDVLGDLPQVEALRRTVRENLGRVEFSLRRQVRGDSQPAALTGSEAVPEEYRRLVEEYYRALARERGGN